MIPVSMESVQGKWMAGALEMDPQVYRPVNNFMHFKADSTMSYLNYGSDTTLRYEVRKDSVVLPFSTRPISEYKRYLNKFIIGRFQQVHYIKLPENTVSIDSIGLQGFLTGSNWESERDFMVFENDSLMVFNKKRKLKEKLCWNIVDYQGMKFIQPKGNFANCDIPNRYLQFVSSLGDDSFSVIRWESNDFVEVKYKKAKLGIPDYDYPEFQLCDPYIYKNNPSDRYYFKYTSFEGGLYRLRQIYEEKYRPVLNGNNNGIVRIIFVVNCEGDIGQFDVLELDGDYKKKKLTNGISSQLLAILKEAGKWNAGKRRDYPVDTYKYLSFKIKDGKILEIFP